MLQSARGSSRGQPRFLVFEPQPPLTRGQDRDLVAVGHHRGPVRALTVDDEGGDLGDLREAFPVGVAERVGDLPGGAARGFERSRPRQLPEGREQSHVDRHRRSRVPAAMPTG